MHNKQINVFMIDVLTNKQYLYTMERLNEFFYDMYGYIFEPTNSEIFYCAHNGNLLNHTDFLVSQSVNNLDIIYFIKSVGDKYLNYFNQNLVVTSSLQ